MGTSVEKFWETTVKIRVLSRGKGPPDFLSLSSVEDAMSFGDCSGDWDTEHREITREQAREILADQGSDENFLELGESDSSDSD